MIDLHTHSTVSDGTDSVPEVIRAAHAAGVEVLALTDHDTMDGVDLAQDCGRREGVEVLNGMEMSTHLLVDNIRRPVHLLAYGCSHEDQPLADLLARVREARVTRVPRMLELLAELGMPLTLEEVEAWCATSSTTGRPHVADAMVHRGYVASRDEAFARYLYDDGPAYVSRYTPTVAEAVDAVNAAHGVAVVAHPWARGGAAWMTVDAIADLAADHGLVGIEADHVDHSISDRGLLHRVADDLGLVATGSSDYHGRGKTRNPLGACHTPREAYETITAEIRERGGHL
ncbi:MAG: PHP domain-containing protein [Propionibacteriaceae bacterium]|nr:PHP domain-containing protein [Propionibacteriaceae bacterium]